MHGTIALESKLGVGTKASFEIPFKKTEYESNSQPIVDLGSIPDRLQSDMSISIGSSEDRHTPPMTPTEGTARLPHARQQPSRVRAGVALDDVMHLPDSERQKLHVLVVEDNQINQQIALKTIKKLHFSVSAVWNGQEALDYILAAEQDHSVPKPDIILMDCQMPVLDGYRATQHIRTQEPYRNLPSLQELPIIAMTASAIQGDKERCKRAGMDDYLAKPVRGKVLERMLIKWAVERRRHLHSKQVELAKPPSDSSGSQGPNVQQAAGAQPGHYRFATQTMINKLAENEGASAARRAEAEEKAMSLRDSKLLSSAENPQQSHRTAEEPPSSRPLRPSAPTHALTQENINKFVDSQENLEGREASVRPELSSREDSGSSLMVNQQREARPYQSRETPEARHAEEHSASTLTPSDGPD